MVLTARKDEQTKTKMTFETKFRNIVGRAIDLDKTELVITLRELLTELNKEQKVKISGWKGKSSFKYSKVGDAIHVQKYKRDDKDEEAKPQNFEIKVEDYENLKILILSWFKYRKNIHLDVNNSPYIKSTELAEEFYKKDWDTEIFNNRKCHNLYTITLNVMDEENIIRYSGRGHIYLK